MTTAEFNTFLANAREALLAERTPGGFWVGELSTSALSTATALFALSLFRQAKPDAGGKYDALIRGGLRWLADNQNADGGWGDTTKSFSNISTTCLCWAAFNVPEATGFDSTVGLADAWIRNEAGTLDAKPLAKKIADRYGKDRTFSVPILTMLALAGRLGNDPWRLVPQLPFELAALPFRCFQILQLPVVSYALPALIAIGQVKHAKRPTWNPITRFFRWLTKTETLRKLREIQPTTGGYLEAAPLTSFVAMSLIGAGQSDHEVVTHALRFLEDSIRPDGSWPIDTNLTTWVTTLAINAMGGVPDRQNEVRDWLLKQQYRTVHPYTQTAPGGWAWTELSGGVPDADDTPGALLALAKLGEPDADTVSAAEAGVTWLLDLQNADGGMPTFCKGWTGLPFDRSSNDLTAHAILAWDAWRGRMPSWLRQRIDAGIKVGVHYLTQSRTEAGWWLPLWFGNQHAEFVANVTYGTSRVVRLARIWRTYQPTYCKYYSFMFTVGLVPLQNPDGGWGGTPGTPSSIEETALAIEGLCEYLAGVGELDKQLVDTITQALDKGIDYLAAATRHGTHFPPSPIGFYFANLWYFEKLYPVIYTVAALTRFANLKATEVSPS